MPAPRDRNAKRFYLAAEQRLSDAEYLSASDRTTAAVYLAGYAVECVLKALVLMQHPAGKRDEVLDLFRGTAAHNFDWLRHLYQKHGGPLLPKGVIEAFLIVNEWGTDLRYQPGTIPADEAEEFLRAARNIWAWADGRL